MKEEVSNQTVAVLAILTIVVSLAGVLTVFAETKAEEGIVQVSDVSAQGSAQGSIQLSVREPLRDSSFGSVAISITDYDA